MAEITTANGHQQAGVRKSKKLSTKVDLTPMVDLGFLLITFFVITSSMTKPRELLLNLPASGPPMKSGTSTTLTLIPLNGSQVFYYHGELREALAAHQYGTTGISILHGIGDIIREKQQLLNRSGKYTAKDLVVIIKPDVSASYKTVTAALDEMLIDNVGRYALVDLDKAEKDALVQLHIL